MRIGSMFSGIGGLDLVVPGTLAWHAEIDVDACFVLNKHWPTVPNLGDVSRVAWGTEHEVDLITAGFPCQDISAAGKRKGIVHGKKSGLWTQVVRCVRALRPGLLFVENVRRIYKHDLATVASDLAACGYRFAWTRHSSAAVGAPHRRERFFLLAAPDNAGKRWEGEGVVERERPQYGETSANSAPDSDRAGRPWLSGSHGFWHTEQDGNGARGDDAVRRGAGVVADAYGVGLRDQPGRSGGANGEGEGVVADDGRFPERFRPAIEHWERTIGRRAPPMGVRSARGFSVLNPAFSEWMMGFPCGWTEGVKSNARLRLVGNAVHPQAASEAFRYLHRALTSIGTGEAWEHALAWANVR